MHQFKEEEFVFLQCKKTLLMFHYITRAEYFKRIEDALIEQRKKVIASREAAAELIDSLGMRHLLIPMTEDEIKAAQEKRAAEKEQMDKIC